MPQREGPARERFVQRHSPLGHERERAGGEKQLAEAPPGHPLVGGALDEGAAFDHCEELLHRMDGIHGTREDTATVQDRNESAASLVTVWMRVRGEFTTGGVAFVVLSYAGE